MDKTRVNEFGEDFEDEVNRYSEITVEYRFYSQVKSAEKTVEEKKKD